jgi:hypothetical protein
MDKHAKATDRETSEGWLLTVETEANGGFRSAHERGPSLGGSLGSLCKYKRVLSCLGCSSRPSTKIMFPVTDVPAPLSLGDDLEVTLQGKAFPSH